MQRVVIVGSNRGIGLELVRQYSNRGDKVFALCRTTSEELNKIPKVTVLEGFDISSDAVIEHVEGCEQLPSDLDVVIVNAGIGAMDNLDSFSDTEKCSHTLNVNAIGPMRIAHAMKSRLPPGSKFGILSSRMGSIADNGSGKMYSYRMSKAAVNAGAKSLTVDWKADGIAVAILHPGYVRTDMTGGNGNMDVTQSVTGLVARMDGVTMENSGTFWNGSDGEVIPW